MLKSRNFWATALPYLMVGCAAAAFLLLAKPPFAAAPAQQPDGRRQEYGRARVQAILSSGERDLGGFTAPFQHLEILLLDGPERGQIITLQHGGGLPVVTQHRLHAGQEIVLTTFTTPDGAAQRYVADIYRLDYLPWLLGGFAVLATATAGWRGAGSMLGLAVSLIIIVWMIVPRIVAGDDPLLVSIGGSLAILLTTTYLAHGISSQTTVALVATLLALVLTALLSVAVVNLTSLAGLGAEEAHTLQIGSATAKINLQGLFLSGVIISTLGALNDITVTQAVTVFELAHLDRELPFLQLVRRGLVIGREHVASLVNTLVLAYAGASMAVFIILVVNPSQQPFWVMLNSEALFEEIVRSVVGSAGLILAVPLVTVLAGWYVTRRGPNPAA